MPSPLRATLRPSEPRVTRTNSRNDAPVGVVSAPCAVCARSTPGRVA